jgi:hypothetical protein
MIMKSIRYKTVIASISLAFIVSACSDFLDINKDPNNPTDVSLALLLPYSQAAIVGAVDNTAGGLTSHTQTIVGQYTQRGTMSDYGLQPNDFPIQIGWAQFYTEALTDLNIVISKGIAQESWHYVGIAQVMEAYVFGVAVDLWGDVPFSEAGLGSANPFPHYDSGEDVYAGIFTMLDDAIDNFEKDAPPVTSDLFYGGDPDQWRKLAKTLKLKLLNQVRLVQDVSAEVTALVNEGDLILDIEDDWELPYGTSISPENRNPGFVQEWTAGGQFYYIDPYFFETMNGTETFFPGGNIFLGISDPRIPYYFFNQLPTADDGAAQNPCAYCPSRSGTPFLSIFAFSFNIDPNEGFDQGRSQTVPGLYPMGGRYNDGAGGVASNASALTAGQVTGPGNVPQRLLTSFQTKYILAELALAGLISGDPRALLEDAIRDSFAKVNQVAPLGSAPTISTTSINNYVNAVLAVYDGGGVELQVIMTQKWIASFGYGIDSYNDYRRTGFPVLHDGNTDNLVVTTRTRNFPVSFPHELQDLITNPNAPEQRVISEDRVFWDPN